jgi:hypothetical protein
MGLCRLSAASMWFVCFASSIWPRAYLSGQSVHGAGAVVVGSLAAPGCGLQAIESFVRSSTDALLLGTTPVSCVAVLLATSIGLLMSSLGWAADGATIRCALT